MLFNAPEILPRGLLRPSCYYCLHLRAEVVLVAVVPARPQCGSASPQSIRSSKLPEAKENLLQVKFQNVFRRPQFLFSFH
jgi:hypothetical protein